MGNAYLGELTLKRNTRASSFTESPVADIEGQIEELRRMPGFCASQTYRAILEKSGIVFFSPRSMPSDLPVQMPAAPPERRAGR